MLQRMCPMIMWKTGKIASYVPQVSIVVMVTGAAIAGFTDLSYSLPGYIWVSICAVSTAAYLLLIRKLSDKTGRQYQHPAVLCSHCTLYPVPDANKRDCLLAAHPQAH